MPKYSDEEKRNFMKITCKIAADLFEYVFSLSWDKKLCIGSLYKLWYNKPYILQEKFGNSLRF